MDRAPGSRSRLPFASALLDRAVALHSNLALMFGRAPRRLPEAAVLGSNRVCSGNVNTTDHHD